MTKARSNTNQTLRVCLYLFLNKFGIKPKNELVPNDLQILCKLPHDKLVYQNKFHNFWNYTVAYKNHGNCIYQLMDRIFEHKKFIQISYFKFLNHTRACTEDTQNFSEFLEL